MFFGRKNQPQINITPLLESVLAGGAAKGWREISTFDLPALVVDKIGSLSKAQAARVASLLWRSFADTESRAQSDGKAIEDEQEQSGAQQMFDWAHALLSGGHDDEGADEDDDDVQAVVGDVVRLCSNARRAKDQDRNAPLRVSVDWQMKKDE